MKEKVAITLDESLLGSIDQLVANGIGKNRSQIIESFLTEHISESHNIQAIIFAHDTKWDGGEYGFDLPKQLINVEGKPVLFHQLRIMSQGGVRRVVIVIEEGKTELYMDILNPYFPHMDIVYTEIRADMRTGEALRAGYAMLENPDYILVTNGDTYIPDLLLRDFYEYHTSQKADCSIVLKYIRTNIEKFGNVTIHGNHVEEFIEKPKSADLYKYLTNSGWYLFSYPFYQSLSYHGEYMETDLFPTLPQKGNTLAYIYSKPWYHVQSLAEYEQANGYV